MLARRPKPPSMDPRNSGAKKRARHCLGVAFCLALLPAYAARKQESSAATIHSNVAPASSLPKEDLYDRALALYRKGQYAKAAPLYRKACEGGNGSACTNFGYMYERGLGVDKNESSAATLYRRGCGAADAQGCTNLALLYFRGRGVEKDLHRAAELDQRGCEGGSASGCANLGTIYSEGPWRSPRMKNSAPISWTADVMAGTRRPADI